MAEAVDQFVIEATVIVEFGPRRPNDQSEVVLFDRPTLKVCYAAHETPITIQRTVTGAPGGEYKRIDPHGALKVKRVLNWPVSVVSRHAPVGEDQRQYVDLSGEQFDLLHHHFSHTIQLAKLAFESCCNSEVVYWGTFESRQYWIDAAGRYLYPIGGTGSVSHIRGAELTQAEIAVFSDIATLIVRGGECDKVLEAYRLACHTQEVPEARLVFAWAAIERLVKSILGRKPKDHKEILEKAIEYCKPQLVSPAPSPFSDAEVIAALTKARDERNNIAHGDDISMDGLDFSALIYALKLLMRAQSQRP